MDVPVRNSTGRLGPMIDVRGQGGYVVAAGSRLHPRPDRDDASAETERAGLPPGQRRPSGRASRLAGRRHNRATGSETTTRPLAAAQRSTRDQSMSSPSDSYGAAALRGESDRVRSAPVGQRNHTLNSAAYSLGQLVAAGALDQARAVQALTDAAADAGLEAAEIAATIESGLSAGLKRPRALPERAAAERSAAVGPATSWPRSSTGATRRPAARPRPQPSVEERPDPHMVLDAAIEQARRRLPSWRPPVPAPTAVLHEGVRRRRPQRPAGVPAEPKVAQ